MACCRDVAILRSVVSCLSPVSYTGHGFSASGTPQKFFPTLAKVAGAIDGVRSKITFECGHGPEPLCLVLSAALPRGREDAQQCIK